MGKLTSLFIQNVEGFILIIFEIVNENQQPKRKEEMKTVYVEDKVTSNDAQRLPPTSKSYGVNCEENAYGKVKPLQQKHT